jgi:hypothetical protein
MMCFADKLHNADVMIREDVSSLPITFGLITFSFNHTHSTYYHSTDLHRRIHRRPHRHPQIHPSLIRLQQS